MALGVRTKKNPDTSVAEPAAVTRTEATLDRARAGARAIDEMIGSLTAEAGTLTERLGRIRQEFADLDRSPIDVETKLVTRLTLQQEIDAAGAVRRYLDERIKQLGLDRERALGNVRGVEAQAHGIRQQIEKVSGLLEQQQQVVSDAERAAEQQRRMERPEHVVQAAESAAMQQRTARARLEAQLAGLHKDLQQLVGA